MCSIAVLALGGDFHDERPCTRAGARGFLKNRSALRKEGYILCSKEGC
jgi:hypothetical protein